MIAPKLNDFVVKVHAFFTDVEFGYDRWIADQFLDHPGEPKPALLLIYNTQEERDAAAERYRDAASLDPSKCNHDVSCAICGMRWTR